MKPPTTLTDGVVVLRELREDDRAVVLSTMADELVHRWLNMPARPRHADFDALLRAVREGRTTGDRIDYAVTEAGLDIALGAVIASRRARDNYEVAYLAGAAGRGRGLMTRGVLLLCEWLFRAGIGRLELRTHPENEPSQRLAERAASSGRGSSASRSGCTGGGRTRSSGRCSRTIRGDRPLPAQPDARSDPDQACARLAPPARGEACGGTEHRCFARLRLGVIAITFLLFNDPRARFVPARAEPVALPPNAEFAPLWRQALSATLPSTVGLAVLASITLVPQPTLTALLAGVCAGLGVAAALSLPRIDPDLCVDPRTEILYRR